MNTLRVLIACEFSGTLRDRFRDAGFHAWSCDLEPCETPGLHYQGDVRDMLDGFEPVNYTAECGVEDLCQTSQCVMSDCRCVGPTQDAIEYTERNGVLFSRPVDRPHWDLIIAHPPCTYLAVSGIHWNTRRPERAQLTEQALDFVRELMAAPCAHIAIENPVSVISTRIGKPTQIVQPWYFGDDASKKTCLWLKGIPKLKDTARLDGDHTTRRANQTPSGQNKLGPSADRWKQRSKTYPGFADAIVEQWGDYMRRWETMPQMLCTFWEHELYAKGFFNE